jgi:hypothetical protein
MTTSIVFSKNRACQLDLLLRSILQNLPDFDEIHVLYHATEQQYLDGYEIVQKRFPWIYFQRQNDFETDTRNLLENWVDEYVCFFVDDNIVYRPVLLTEDFLDSMWNSIPEMTCFTLRLGKNTVIQDQYNNQPVVFPKEFLVGNINDTNVLVWNWTTVQVFGDFGYPFSVDGHIYKLRDILPLLDYKFENPNAFEGRFNKNSFKTRAMACFEQSALVNTPLNLVGSSNNNAGRWYGHTLEELNQKYLDNHQISLNSITNTKVVAAHQEMEIEYECW